MKWPMRGNTTWVHWMILGLVFVVASISLEVVRRCHAPAPPPPPVERTYTDAGTLINITRTGWQIWRVETTKGVFHLYYATSGMKGARVSIRDDGYLFIEGASVGNKILE